MISAIIFDCFGVLTTDCWLPFKAKAFGHDPDLFSEASNLNKRSNAGLISPHDFINGIAELASMSVPEAKKAIEDNVANEPLFAYIQELKKAFKIGMLSNASGDWLADMFAPEQLALFDAVALSYETGYIKPDLRAYEAIASRLGVDTPECVLIDDQELYCTAALEAGMKSIWYRDFEQTRNELNQLLKDRTLA